MDDLDSAIVDAVQGVTKKWAKQRKAEERSQRQASNRRYAFRQRPTTVKEAAYSVMERAYQQASANGRYPANARQIMYAARPHIQKMTGEPLKDAYFTQRLLPDYIEETGVTWDVVFDARGNFNEPHTKANVPLGTISVRNYLRTFGRHADDEHPRPDPISSRFPSRGPANRYGAVLFIEKEGFEQLLTAATIAERFDIAIMSTKGMSVTASRHLIEQLNVPILVLHDFDQSGFSIIGTLRRSTRRYRFSRRVEVIDLGLTLADIAQYDLEAEHQSLTHSELTLRENGATAADIEFLSGDQRVELNMLTSDQLVELIESKLVEHGVVKVVPDREVLEAAYRRAYEVQLLNNAVTDAAERAATRASETPLPDDLDEQVRAYIEEHPEKPWDDAVAAIVSDAEEGEAAS